MDPLLLRLTISFLEFSSLSILDINCLLSMALLVSRDSIYSSFSFINFKMFSLFFFCSPIRFSKLEIVFFRDSTCIYFELVLWLAISVEILSCLISVNNLSLSISNFLWVSMFNFYLFFSSSLKVLTCCSNYCPFVANFSFWVFAYSLLDFSSASSFFSCVFWVMY